jgi:asparaginyl-tRNA synthetase
MQTTQQTKKHDEEGTKNERALIARIESSLSRGADDYFREHNFIRVPTVPHLVGITGACENIDTLYKVNHFGQNAFLTQTGQLMLELQIPELERVCCEIHSFRAEESVDARHLCEFPLVEFEFGYTGEGLPQLLGHIEGTIKEMLASVLNKEAATLERLHTEPARIERMISEQFNRITYREAIEMLNKKGYSLSFGDDLKHDHEQAVVYSLGGLPTFITHYPEAIKFFNMRRDRDDTSVVQSSDLILPYSGEAVGSAVREEDPDLLVEKLVNSAMYNLHTQRGGTLEEFRWYLEAVKVNPVPHAGCGIGLSRVTQSVLGRNDIRMSTAYPINASTML